MNQVKFQYIQDTVEFYIHFKGVKVIVLTAKLPVYANLGDFKRLRGLAMINAREVEAELRVAA